MQQAFIFIKPDPTVLRKDDVPEVEDLFHLKAVVDAREDFLDKGRRILLDLILCGGLFREKFVVDFDEIVRIGLFNGFSEPINGLPLRDCCHDRSSRVNLWDGETTSSIIPQRPSMWGGGGTWRYAVD